MPRIVRDDVKKISRLLQRSDDRIVRAFEDPNHPALRRPVALFARAYVIASDPRHHFVAVHRGAGVFGRNEKILLSRFLARGRRSRPGERAIAGDQVRFRGKDVTVLPDAGDFPGLLQFPQRLV